MPESSLSGNRIAYGRGQDNPIGLKLTFSWDGCTAQAVFIPAVYHQGWPGVVHGGVILALLDEAAGQATSFSTLNCVSARVQVKLKQPARINEPLTVTASVREVRRSLVLTHAIIRSADGTEIAGGDITLVIIDPSRVLSPQDGKDNQQYHATG